MPNKVRANTTFVESVPVRDFYESFQEPLQLELVAGAAGLDKTIGERSLNRPALALTGYFKYFAAKRIQLFGAGEMAYLRDLDDAQERSIMTQLLERTVPCMVISRDLMPTQVMQQLADRYQTPLIRSSLKSKELTTEATLLLEEKFAPARTSTVPCSIFAGSGRSFAARAEWGRVSVPWRSLSADTVSWRTISRT